MPKPVKRVDATASNGIQKISGTPKHIPLDRDSKNAASSSKTVWIAGALIVIVLIILGALAAQKLFNNPPTPPITPDQNAFGLVRGKLLYSNDCKVCEKTGLLLLAFQNEGYASKVDLVEASSPEGRSMVSTFAVDSVPTLFLESDSLNALPKSISDDLKQHYPVRGNYLVIPEIAFMKQTGQFLSNVMFLRSPDASCSVSPNAVQFAEFSDFADCPLCKTFYARVQNIREEFGPEMSFRFRNTLFHGAESERASIAAACAQQQGVWDDFSSCAFNLDENGSFLDANTIRYCAQQSHVPNLASFSTCVDQNQTASIAGHNGSDNALSRSYFIDRIPSFVVDCKILLASDGLVVRADGSKYSPQLKEEICRQRSDLRTCQNYYNGTT